MTHASRGSKGNPTAVWRALSKASVLIFCLIDHFLPLAELSLCSFCKESIPCLRGVGNIWMRVRLTGIDLQPCGVTPGKFQTPPPLPPTHPMQLGFHPFKISNVSDFFDMYTLLYLKWITNKDLLYSTGNSAQYYVTV